MRTSLCGLSLPLLFMLLTAIAVINTLTNYRILSDMTNSHEAAQSGFIATNGCQDKEDVTKIKKFKDYEFTAAICVIVKDVEAYFLEWIDYHLVVLNFQNIYMYDNSDGFDLKGWYESSRNHDVYRRVTIIHKPGGRNSETAPKKINYNFQQEVVEECVQKFGKDASGPQHDYMALIDIDEFFVIQNQYNFTDIRDVLNKYLVPYGGSLTVNWMLVGTSNHTIYAPIPLLKRFQYHDPEPDMVVKSIVKSADYKSSKNPHAVNFNNEKSVARTTKYPGCIQNGDDKGGVDPDLPSGVLLLYHYRYLSEKEYTKRRCRRGNLGKKWCTKDGKKVTYKGANAHIIPRPGKVFDNRPWRLLMSAVPKYRMYEHQVDFG